MSLPSLATVRRGLAVHRATGADLPFGGPLRAHDVAMEGYFWRFTDPSVCVAFAGGDVARQRPRAGRGHGAEPS